ncbi:ArsR family transcriptional regulator [Sphaerisporangium krabiense]|uniref:Putative nucleotidyltransferase n=1 Tax=Sphaerisporangium krabiense TaxID=763782 RepID=A0A7W8Z603_9ACTN|nr:ArsR family transcriptional regulator [Sphaerisporangium krabiense]MBB5627763.1 putative nucleotidyltransferase [Sphaerisporangium krabiense]GII61921.1 ArsR family transcriptional regulator [Sphaerisporangium krabiense]
MARLYLAADREFSISEFAAALAHPVSTTQREADRLVGAGLLRERRIGRTRLLQANTEAASYRPLTQLLAVSFGAPAIIGEQFAGIAGIRELVIFGSWAARYHGEPGPQPRDVDLLVIGCPSRGDVYDSAERAEQRIGLSVDPVIRSVSAWESGQDGLVRQIKGSRMFEITHSPRGDDSSAVDPG